ncbi:uncharacterized protein E0L32_010587 [Thyridium curvatum]|uniref:Uncharacterized protein n=1 Tax=Thyridium curvatum TaxID=1093900 RepID=A0A507AS32_9PEZI|nr:uncharacterized protein E0L32_010587 [Thyridium curvatum]TPX07691.1 hypothetical protein E0L32_010587 [Thyridium curvatum]
MKLQILTLLLLGVGPAICSKLAFGYEAVMFYTIYRLDYFTNANSLTLAKGCHPVPCNFDEFIKYISKTTFYTGSGGKIKNLVDPDIDEARRVTDFPGNGPQRSKTDKTRRGYEGTYDQKLLLGSKWEENLKHGDVIDRLADIVQDCRQKRGGQVDHYVKKSITCMDAVHSLRKQEQSAGIIQLANKKLKSYNIGITQVSTKTVTTPDGKSYQEFDAADTIRRVLQTGNNGQKLVPFLTNLVNEYNTNGQASPKGVGVAHGSVMRSYEKALSRLRSIDPWSCP